MPKQISAPYWFLNDADDVRSSNFWRISRPSLIFKVLKLIGFAWLGTSIFTTRVSSGNARTSVEQVGSTHSESDQMYLKNAYRVLLTRARQGLIIYVPYGDEVDKTRPVSKYNGVFTYLKIVD